MKERLTDRFFPFISNPQTVSIGAAPCSFNFHGYFDVHGDDGGITLRIEAEDIFINLFFCKNLSAVPVRYSQIAYSPLVSGTDCSLTVTILPGDQNECRRG